jgi:succinate dehydrogenase flavin-adding protein (antitoxin of CptAB toxin-antitoxin module)
MFDEGNVNLNIFGDYRPMQAGKTRILWRCFLRGLLET